MKTKVHVLASLLAICSLGAQAQWVNQPVAGTNANQINLVISAIDANVAWTTVVNLDDDNDDNFFTQLFSRTANGGATWTTTTVAGLARDEVITALYAQSATTAWVTVGTASAAGTGRVLRTTDGGITWAAQTTATQFASPNSVPGVIRFFDANNGVVVGNPVNGRFEVYTTSNAGAIWTAVPVANTPAQQDQDELPFPLPVVAQSGNSIWIGTDEGRVLRSTDRGLTWAASATGLPSLEAVAFRDAQNGLAMEQEGDYVRSTDGGVTWAQLNPIGPARSIGLDNIPGTRTYVSTGFGDFDPGSSYSTDDGQTWTAIESTINHALVDFVSPTVGWSGGLVVDADGDAVGGNGMNKYVGQPLATNAALAARLGINAYPNPAPDGRFLVKAAGLKAATPVRVVDNLGRLVLTQTWTSPALAPLTLNLSLQAPGVYVLELNTPEGLVRQKLVVR
jgi:photosystem II stability/assembly factor-like uncharacterized protein